VSASITLESMSYKPMAALSDGNHTAFLKVKDNIGNEGTTSWSFIIDTTPPMISNLHPSNSSVTSINIPTISADYDDASDIFVKSVVLKIDDVNVTASATVTATGVSYTPTEALADGLHTVNLRIEDIYGNRANETWTFTVNSTVSDKDPIYKKDNTPENWWMFLLIIIIVIMIVILLFVKMRKKPAKIIQTPQEPAKPHPPHESGKNPQISSLHTPSDQPRNPPNPGIKRVHPGFKKSTNFTQPTNSHRLYTKYER
jgi:hypothetical protein